MKKILIIFFLLTLIAINGCQKSKKNYSEPPIVTSVESLDIEGYEEIKKQHKGKVLIINFFASWCPPCKDEAPAFAKIYDNYKDKNFAIVGISIDDNKEDVIDFINKYRLKFPVYISDKSLPIRFNVKGVPTNFIYNVEGKLANIFQGPLSETYLKSLAESVNK